MLTTRYRRVILNHKGRTSSDQRLDSALLPKTCNAQVKTMVQQIQRSTQAFEISPEVKALLYSKEIVAQVLSWDQCYGLELAIRPEEIEFISFNKDIVEYGLINPSRRLTGEPITEPDTKIPLSIEQFVCYWNLIKIAEQEGALVEDEVQATYNPIPTVKSAKKSGDLESCGIREVWDCSVKAGYILRFGEWWYAVSESYKLVNSGSEVRYSWSRHSSESLAEGELLEQLLPW